MGRLQVTELSCRSALLQWRPPDCKSTPELEVTEDSVSYEVLLSDKGKEGKYKSIYSGPALSCRFVLVFFYIRQMLVN